MTELQNAAKAAATRPRIQPAEEGDDRPLSVSARLGRLQFHQSGKFRVLQLTDIQDGPKVSKDTVKLIEASLDATRPDIVIFTGNQIAGYDPAYAQTTRKRRWSASVGTTRETASSKSSEASERFEAALERTRASVRATVEQLVRPLADRGIPWAVTFGNHDFQCGLGNAEIESICREFPGCLNPDPAGRQAGQYLPSQRVFACEPGTFALPVSDVDHTTSVLGLVLLDSGDYARSGGYGSPSAEALRFLAEVPEMMSTQSQKQVESHETAKSQEQAVPCMVFQHFPVQQYYQLLKPAATNAARAIEGYRNFAGKHYVLDEEKTLPGSYLGEGISCPDADSGEFAILEQCGYFAISAGHDHRNAFVGTVPISRNSADVRMAKVLSKVIGGLMMIASPTSGFGSYGPVPQKRAARLIEFDIRHPYEPRTQLLEYGELVGKPSAGKAYAYGMTSESKPESEGVDLLHRPTWWSKLLSWLRK